MDEKEILRVIVEIHQITKGFTTKGEELNPEFKSFLQPLNELKNTLEHLIRYEAAKLEFGGEKKSDSYITTNLEKALGHECRAFFDTVDWLTVLLRKKVNDLLKPYSPESINKGLPEYYRTIRPRLEEINNIIAQERSRKDIGNGKEILPQIYEYSDVVTELFDIHKIIVNSVGSIVEFHDLEREESKKGSFRFGVTIILMIVICFISIAGTYFFTSKSNSQPTTGTSTFVN